MATLLFLLILAVCLEACTANTTSSGLKTLACSAGNFTAGDNATVTCHLPTDVNATMHHVYVTWYPFKTNNVYKDVITCFRRRNGLLKCDVLDGYKYNNVISDTLIFEIPEITPDFAGRYSCLLVPPWGPPPDLCTLHVKTDITRADNTKARGTPQTEPEDTKPCSDFSSYTIFMAYQSILLTFTCILVISLAVKTFWNCRYQCKRRLACCRHPRRNRTHRSRPSAPLYYLSSTSRKELEMQKRALLEEKPGWEEYEPVRDLGRNPPPPAIPVRYTPARQNVMLLVNEVSNPTLPTSLYSSEC